MSDEIRELRNEIIALKEIVGKMYGKNADLLGKVDKLTEKIESLNSEKSDQVFLFTIIL